MVNKPSEAGEEAWPPVSVVMPVRNRASVVGEAISHYGLDADAPDPADPDTLPRGEAEVVSDHGRRVDDE